MRLLVKRAECNSHWISGISKEPLWFFQWKTFFSTDTPSIPDTIGEILSGNECGTRIHTEKQLFSFFLSFFSLTVEWKLHLAPDRNENHCMSFPVLFYFDISLIHRVLSCVTKYPQCGKICPSCYGRKSNRVGGFQGFAEAVLQKGDVILWYEARLNLNTDWLLSHCTTGPVCV